MAGALCLLLNPADLFSAAEHASEFKAPGRVIAIGDVHGSYEGLLQNLRATGLVDEEGRWSGGDATLVQTGDLTDRGSAVKDVFDLLRRLQGEAKSAGGRVVTLFGNHEVWNLVGIFSPNSTEPEVFAELVGRFVDGRSEKRQREALRSYRAWQERYPGCGIESKEEWLAAHPLGFVEFVKALSPKGQYGRWLRRFPVAVKIDDTIFVHGGLSPALEEMGFGSLDEINSRIRDEIELFDTGREWLEENGLAVPGSTVAETLCAIDSEIFRRVENGGSENGAQESEDEVVIALRHFRKTVPSAGWLSLHSEGPLWFRGYAFWSDEEGQEALPGVLSRFGARHLVVGHTPQPGDIKSRFDGRVFLIDTALVFGEAAGGGPAALEIRDGVFSAVYPHGSTVLWDLESGARAVEAENGRFRWKGPDGEILPLSSPEQVEGFLRTATVVSQEEIPIGVTKPKRFELERDGVRARAAFRYHHEEARSKKLESSTVIMFKDSFENEILAYELSRMMDFGRVPPTVARTVDGVEGSVQIWVENATMDVERRSEGLKPPDRLRFERQRFDMHVFDNLIGNFDRNQGNILIDEEWKVWLIDHTRAFRALGDLPEPRKVVRCSRPLYEAIVALDRAALDERLGGLLLGSEIKALLRRRDRILKILQQRIEEHGEAKVIFDWDDPNPDIRIFEAPEVSAEEAAGIGP